MKLRPNKLTREMIPVRLSIALKHLLPFISLTILNTVRYNMRCKKLITFYKFVYQNILSFAKIFIVIIFTKYYNEDSK